MWTLFAFAPYAPNAPKKLPAKLLIFVDTDVQEAERLFQQATGVPPSRIGFLGFTGSTREEAWTRVVQRGLAPEPLRKATLTQVLQHSRVDVILRPVRSSDQDAMTCTSCHRMFRGAKPNTVHATYCCDDCRSNGYYLPWC